MSGGSSEITRGMYDLLLYWVAALLAALIGTPTRIPPLLFYLVFGAILGNLDIVKRGEGVEFFAEWSITIVFFSLGLEETVEHFMEGIRKAWGIALIGALVPFGCGYLCGYIFWPDESWRIHLTIATAVTATAVSLTMIVLQSVGLLKSRAAMGIMTSAVLDDVGCLILVAILVPIVVAAGPANKIDVPEIRSASCALPDLGGENITGVIELSSTANLATMQANATAVELVRTAFINDLANNTRVPASLIFIPELNLHPTFNATFTVLPSSMIGLTGRSFSAALQTAFADRPAPSGLFETEKVIDSSVPATGIAAHTWTVTGGIEPEEPHEGITVVGIIMIIVYVIIFFVVLAFLHNVVLPHDIKEGPISYIPIVRTYGIKHLLQLFEGLQVPLIIVTFGLAVGMMGAALGFHPAVGAYFAGLLLDETYFDVDPPKPEIEEKKEEEEDEDVMTPGPGSRRRSRRNSNLSVLSKDPIPEPEPEPVNTMEHAKDAVGTASFMWLGPVFFVHLGAGLEIQTSLLAEGVPKALGIFAILWVGQFISATLSARFVPGGFSWAESVVVGFGMLGRAELYFVVLNIAKKEKVFGNDIFFPMALAALLMNITLPITITGFRPVYLRHHPEDDPNAKPQDKDKPVGPAVMLGSPTASEMAPEKPVKRRSAVTRRGIGIAGVDLGTENDDLDPRQPTRNISRLGIRTPSRTASRLSRGPSRLQRRSNNQFDDPGVFEEMELPPEAREPYQSPTLKSPDRRSGAAKDQQE